MNEFEDKVHEWLDRGNSDKQTEDSYNKWGGDEGWWSTLNSFKRKDFLGTRRNI